MMACGGFGIPNPLPFSGIPGPPLFSDPGVANSEKMVIFDLINPKIADL